MHVAATIGGASKDNTMTTITVLRPVHVRTPRVAGLAAALFTGLLSWFESNRTAKAEERAEAQRTADAASVREYANRCLPHDPRFAADLMAAADRHERGL